MNKSFVVYAEKQLKYNVYLNSITKGYVMIVWRNEKVSKLTLDEAIKHCEEKSCGDDQCSQEHRQLAEWLKELKRLREERQVLSYYKYMYEQERD